MNQEELEAAIKYVMEDCCIALNEDGKGKKSSRSHELMNLVRAAQWTLEHKPKWDAMKEQPAPVDVEKVKHKTATAISDDTGNDTGYCWDTLCLTIGHLHDKGYLRQPVDLDIDNG